MKPGTQHTDLMIVQKTGVRLFFAGIAQLGDDLLAHHLGAVIKDLNQAGAGRARIGNNRG